MRKPIHILLVDDQVAYPELLRSSSELWNEHYEFSLTHVRNGIEAMNAIRSGSPSIVLLDAHLPDINIFDFVHQFAPGEPPIVITSEEHLGSLEQCAAEHGAVAYIPKSEDPDEIDHLFFRLAELSGRPFILQ